MSFAHFVGLECLKYIFVIEYGRRPCATLSDMSCNYIGASSMRYFVCYFVLENCGTCVVKALLRRFFVEYFVWGNVLLGCRRCFTTLCV